MNDSWISEEERGLWSLRQHASWQSVDYFRACYLMIAQHVKIHLPHLYREEKKKNGLWVKVAHRHVSCCTPTGSNITHDSFRCGNLWEAKGGDETMELLKTENVFIFRGHRLKFSVDIRVRSAPYRRGSQQKIKNRSLLILFLVPKRRMKVSLSWQEGEKHWHRLASWKSW